ncbi:MAG: Dabb family protein [Acidobacteria bacterium]|nr:Dabb family protein [Acidobacteriota bacterium]
MHSKTLFSFFGIGLSFLLSSFIFSSSLAASPQTSSAQLPDGEGKGYVLTLCTSCHGLGQVLSQRKTLLGWEASVYDMLGRISGGMDREADIISKYLAMHFAAETSTVPAHQQTPDVGESESTGFRIQIFHQVLFEFQPQVSEEQKKAVLESGKKMLESIPEVATVLVGKVSRGSSDFSYGLVTGFKSEEDLQTYRSHPEHRKWLEEIYRPAISSSLVTDIVATE